MLVPVNPSRQPFAISLWLLYLQDQVNTDPLRQESASLQMVQTPQKENSEGLPRRLRIQVSNSSKGILHIGDMLVYTPHNGCCWETFSPFLLIVVWWEIPTERENSIVCSPPKVSQGMEYMGMGKITPRGPQAI